MGRRRRIFNKGEWELQRERFHLDRELPPAAFHAVGIGDVLPGAVKKWGLAAPFQVEVLCAAWEQLVGKDLARRSRPGRLDNKTLTIYVCHPTWLMEIKRMERPLLEKIQSCRGAEQVRTIRLMLDPGDR
jgi:predicted nucleic acid-binding Zn ribbon protein